MRIAVLTVSAVLALGGLALGGISGCSVPWRSYPVSSAISGAVVRGGEPMSHGRIRLQVRNRDNAALGTHEEFTLRPDGRFHFEPLTLKLAGQEYAKRYFLLLYWLDGDRAVTIWAAEYPRSLLGGPIELQCDLDRNERLGPPCRLVGLASDQPWLLAAGAKDYQEFCASCHGREARGGGPKAAGLSREPPDLTRLAARRGGDFPDDEIARFIDGRAATSAHGAREMPVWGLKIGELYVPGNFAQERVRNRIDILVAYLKTLQTD
jgi:hypothetical protein